MPDDYDSIIADAMEALMREGPDGMAPVFTHLFNLAMNGEKQCRFTE